MRVSLCNITAAVIVSFVGIVTITITVVFVAVILNIVIDIPLFLLLSLYPSLPPLFSPDTMEADGLPPGPERRIDSAPPGCFPYITETCLCFSLFLQFCNIIITTIPSGVK